jgi:tetratricopeptide (TPR) repeat protein
MQKKLFLIFSFIFSFLFCVKAQNNNLLQNTVALNLLKQGIQKMYNYNFESADKIFEQAEKLLPQHPAIPMLRAGLLYWQNLPLEESNINVIKVENYLKKAILLAQNMQKKDKNNAEAIFFELTSHSIIMQHYAKIGQQMKALGEAREMYGLLKQGFDLLDQYEEFYFTTGIYNYYRVAYPQEKPIYKPFVWLFKDGNKALGLKQIEYAAKNATITQTQAYFFLTHIYLTYEKNLDKSIGYAKELNNLFPKNRYFLTRYVETLLFSKQYDLALPLVQQLLREPSPEKYTVLIAQVQMGILEEKRNKNFVLAKTYYQNALKLAKPFGNSGKHQQAYCYLGLSRMAAAEKKPKEAKDFRKQAEDLAEYQYIFVFE